MKIFNFKMLVISFCFTLFCAQNASAQVEPMWVTCTLSQIQTGVFDQIGSAEDTRIMATATNGAFTDTWLIIDPVAAKMVAAGALTAISLQSQVVIKILSCGENCFRVTALRVVAQ